MTRYKLVLVPFPFDDYSSSKVRPALCLTEPIGPHRHVILAFMTSQTQGTLLDSELLLDPTQPDFSVTGLRGSGVVRLHRLITAPTSLIQRELGELSPAMRVEVSAKLRALFGLSN